MKIESHHDVLSVVAALHPKVMGEIGVDRQFFRRWPDRAFRLRRAFSNEAETARRLSGNPSPARGLALFVVVRRWTSGALTRVYIVGPADAETDLPDDEVKAIHAEMTDDVAERAALLALWETRP